MVMPLLPSEETSNALCVREMQTTVTGRKKQAGIKHHIYIQSETNNYFLGHPVYVKHSPECLQTIPGT